MKKIIALILALACMTQAAFAAGPAPVRFEDVPDSHWAKPYIDRASTEGWISGVDEQHYCPEEAVTLVDWLIMLTRELMPQYIPESASPRRAARNALQAAEEHGLFRYLPIKTLTVEQARRPVTRMEMACIVSAALKERDIKVPEEYRDLVAACIPDLDNLRGLEYEGYAYRDGILPVYYYHIMKGTDKIGTFSWNRTVTRAQASVILCRLKDCVSGTETVLSPGALLGEQPCVVHGAGLLTDGENQYYGSCSEEAFQSYYDLGYRVFEMDFNFTSDGEMACIHHWDRQFSQQLTAGQAPTMDEFMALKIYDRFTPMNLDSLARRMKQDPQLCVVTDIKDDPIRGMRQIAERYPELKDRFIIQIYDYDQYEPVKEAGFQNIILTIYNMSSYQKKRDAAAIGRFAAGHGLLAITFPAECDGLWPGYTETLASFGVPLFMHTVDDRAQAQAMFRKGVAGFYTDTPEQICIP